MLASQLSKAIDFQSLSTTLGIFLGENFYSFNSTVVNSSVSRWFSKEKLSVLPSASNDNQSAIVLALSLYLQLCVQFSNCKMSLAAAETKNELCLKEKWFLEIHEALAIFLWYFGVCLSSCKNADNGWNSELKTQNATILRHVYSNPILISVEANEHRERDLPKHGPRGWTSLHGTERILVNIKS